MFVNDSTPEITDSMPVDEQQFISDANTFFGMDVGLINHDTEETTVQDSPGSPEGQQGTVPTEDQSNDGNSAVTDVAKVVTPEDYFKQDFQIPEKFDSTEAELNFYKENFKKPYELVNAPEFQQRFAERYREVLIQHELQADQELASLKEQVLALRANPKEAIRQYFPEKIAELGINALMTPDEIDSKVAAQMEEKFGADWYEGYDDKKAIVPGSPSSQYKRFQEQLYSQLYAENQKTEQALQQYNQTIAQTGTAPTEAERSQQLQEFVEAQYTELSKSYPVERSEYDALLNEMKSNQWNPTMVDLYRAKNFDKLLADAKAAGITEGKKSTVNDIARAGAVALQQEEVPKSETSKKVDSRTGDFIGDTMYDLYRQ